jgi:hypothetical protein
MESGRKVYQVLLVKNIFQRNFPEIHFDSDIRPATREQGRQRSNGSRSSCRRISSNWRITLSSSSPKKSSITSLDECYRLDDSNLWKQGSPGALRESVNSER